MEYQEHDLLEIAKLARRHIHMIMNVLSLIAIPLALLPPVPVQWKWIWIRTFVVTVAVWLTMMDFQGYTFAWNRIVLDIEQKNFGYDGVGANAALLVFGWIIPFVECLVTLCLARFILVRMGGRKKPEVGTNA